MFLFICCVCFIRFPFLQCWLNVAVVMMGAFIRAKNPQKWILLFLAWRNGARCFLVMILSAPAWQFVVSPLCFQKDTFFFDCFFCIDCSRSVIKSDCWANCGKLVPNWFSFPSGHLHSILCLDFFLGASTSVAPWKQKQRVMQWRPKIDKQSKTNQDFELWLGIAECC